MKTGIISIKKEIAKRIKIIVKNKEKKEKRLVKKFITQWRIACPWER